MVFIINFYLVLTIYFLNLNPCERNWANYSLRSNDTIRGWRAGAGATNYEEKNYELQNILFRRI